MSTANRFVGLALALSVGLVSAAAQESPPAKPRIDDLVLRVEQGRLHVSFKLVNGLSEEILERIRSGLPVSFRHAVEVSVRRGFRLWPSRTAAQASIETAVAYSSLTRQYELRRLIETSSRGAESRLVLREERHTTKSAEEMAAWMTELNWPALDVSSISDLTRARVRVESTLGRRWIFLWPARQSVSADRRLEP